MDLDKTKIVGIVGDTDTGKTNLGIYLLRNYKGNRKIYTLGYPIQLDNFPQLNKKQELTQITNSIIFVDELARFFPTRERHTNQDFLELARLLGHSKNTLIFTTQLSQDLTNQMESFVDTLLITRMADLRYLKFGSKIKFTILDCADVRMNGHSLNLSPGEYLESCPANEIGGDGIKSFPFQNIGKDWAPAGLKDVISGVGLNGSTESCAELRRVAQSCAELRADAPSCAGSCAGSCASSCASSCAGTCAEA